jgi:hypothetical protein
LGEGLQWLDWAQRGVGEGEGKARRGGEEAG